MTTAINPAVAWLHATFETRRRKAFDHAFGHSGPMFTLKSAMDPGEPMHIRPADYHDPQRWWL
jgi:hypothetical protein